MEGWEELEGQRETGVRGRTLRRKRKGRGRK